MISPCIKRDVLVIGASLGGVSALKDLCGALPVDLPAVVGVVLHRGRWYGGDVSRLYGKNGRIRVQEAQHDQKMERGTVYFAPPDQHMVFEAAGLRLSREAKLHWCRPAIDRLFMSAATSFGQRVAGVLLTGSNTDGAQGLVDIKAAGGVTFVQRPEEAVQPTMPLSGLREDDPDLVSLDALPSLLLALATGQPINSETPGEHYQLMGPRWI